ncbi:hypothetical protein [Paractinoplanes durhamensis]|uniref:Uncharacterized protein n=1 Tax=Paractinoplanes durhamensis TaxID=113563 RepID=A0ABQ3ZF02_9ACTN|nr:hypothetical protein [Actinoplanes durhamensis]GIE08114.1 hypothetical protein Adu01nite_94640 [Actinoplanes durhamensis]
MGEFSEGADTWRDEPGPRPPVGYLPYGDRKPYVLAETLRRRWEERFPELAATRTNAA